MKYIKQFGIILFISFLGELLNIVLPLPVPASIYGLILMLAALRLGIVQLSSFKETGTFLIEIMPLMFIPAGVGLLESWNVLKPMFAVVSLITVISTVFVMAVTGRVTQRIILMQKKTRSTKR